MSYQIIAFLHNAKPTAYELIEKCVSLVEKPIKIYSTPMFRVEDIVQPQMTVLAFGNFIYNVINSHVVEKNLDSVHIVQLPSPKQLTHIPENIKDREFTAQKLEELKELFKAPAITNKELIIEEEDLPSLDAREIALLEMLNENNVCIVTSKNGKLIQVSNNPTDLTKDIKHINFSELLAVRLAMDVLDVKEVKLVWNNQDTDQDFK